MGLLQKATQKYIRTAGIRNEIDEIFEPYLLMQKFYGLQILDPHWTWKRDGICRILSYFLALYVIVGTIEVISNTNDVNLIMEGALTLMVNVQMVSKVAFLLSQREELRANYVTVKTYIYGLLKDTPSKRDKILTKLKLVLRLFTLSTIAIIFSFVALTLWDICKGERPNLSRSTSTLMPESSPYYELGLLIQLFYLTETCFTLMFIDVWYNISCLFFMEASDVAVESLVVESDGSSDTYSKDLNESLRRFYIIHANAMDYLKVLNGNFKWICLVPMTGVLIMMSIFLMMLKQEINLQILVVMVPANAQIFIWNLFGELISTKGEAINMALINFDWTSMTLKDQKKYCIITIYQNRKVAVITALGNALSLITLSSIYKMVYQMFAVINTTL